MTSVRKKLRLDSSKPPTAATVCGPQLLSHDAPSEAPAAASGGGTVREWGEEEEGEEGFLLVEEDTTDSSLIITMGNTQTQIHMGYFTK